MSASSKNTPISDASTLPRRHRVEMTTREFAMLPSDTVAVLPVGAIEQHGPHLPVYVDSCLNSSGVDATIKIAR